jgi:tetraacyldisaccharide-1-P 4'-kinase
MTYSDLTFEEDYPVIITSKDAVKFSSIDLKHVWVLDVKADISTNFVSSLMGAVDINEPN